MPRFLVIGLLVGFPFLYVLGELEVLPFALEAFALKAAKNRKEDTSSRAPLATKPAISTQADAPNPFIEAFNKPLSPSKEITPDTQVSELSTLACILPLYKPVLVTATQRAITSKSEWLPAAESTQTLTLQGTLFGPVSFAKCLRILGDETASGLRRE